MRVFYGTSVWLRAIGPKLNQPISHLAESLFRSLERKLHFCMFPWRFSLHHKMHMNPFLLSFSYQQMFYQPCDWMWKGIAHWWMSFLEINQSYCLHPAHSLLSLTNTTRSEGDKEQLAWACRDMRRKETWSLQMGVTMKQRQKFWTMCELDEQSGCCWMEAALRLVVTLSFVHSPVCYECKASPGLPIICSTA